MSKKISKTKFIRLQKFLSLADSVHDFCNPSRNSDIDTNNFVNVTLNYLEAHFKDSISKEKGAPNKYEIEMQNIFDTIYNKTGFKQTELIKPSNFENKIQLLILNYIKRLKKVDFADNNNNDISNIRNKYQLNNIPAQNHTTINFEDLIKTHLNDNISLITIDKKNNSKDDRLYILLKLLFIKNSVVDITKYGALSFILDANGFKKNLYFCFPDYTHKTIYAGLFSSFDAFDGGSNIIENTIKENSQSYTSNNLLNSDDELLANTQTQIKSCYKSDIAYTNIEYSINKLDGELFLYDKIQVNKKSDIYTLSSTYKNKKFDINILESTKDNKLTLPLFIKALTTIKKKNKQNAFFDLQSVSLVTIENTCKLRLDPGDLKIKDKISKEETELTNLNDLLNELNIYASLEKEINKCNNDLERIKNTLWKDINSNFKRNAAMKYLGAKSYIGQKQLLNLIETKITYYKNEIQLKKNIYAVYNISNIEKKTKDKEDQIQKYYKIEHKLKDQSLIKLNVNDYVHALLDLKRAMDYLQVKACAAANFNSRQLNADFPNETNIFVSRDILATTFALMNNCPCIKTVDKDGEKHAVFYNYDEHKREEPLYLEPIRRRENKIGCDYNRIKKIIKNTLKIAEIDEGSNLWRPLNMIIEERKLENDNNCITYIKNLLEEQMILLKKKQELVDIALNNDYFKNSEQVSAEEYQQQNFDLDDTEDEDANVDDPSENVVTQEGAEESKGQSGGYKRYLKEKIKKLKKAKKYLRQELKGGKDCEEIDENLAWKLYEDVEINALVKVFEDDLLFCDFLNVYKKYLFDTIPLLWFFIYRFIFYIINNRYNRDLNITSLDQLNNILNKNIIQNSNNNTNIKRNSNSYKKNSKKDKLIPSRSPFY